MSEIVIKPDQMAVVKGETVLVTMALGSSLAICMYDEEAGIGGMVHTLLPGINGGKAMEKMVCGMWTRRLWRCMRP